MPGEMDLRSRAEYLLACFSNGYFTYDMMEMVLHVRERGCLELVVHHLFVMSCLSISVVHRQFLGFACIALTVEVSNVFLHTRHLMKIAGWEDSPLFAINRWTNLGTRVVSSYPPLMSLSSCCQSCGKAVSLLPQIDLLCSSLPVLLFSSWSHVPHHTSHLISHHVTHTNIQASL